MQYIAEHTDIPVPRVLRTVKCVRSTWIVMKYIEGETLDDLWPNFSIWRKISIMLTLRRYIRQVHQLPIPSPNTPGPFDDTHKPYRCFGCCFPEDIGGGPFATYSSLTDFMNRKLSAVLARDKRLARTPRPGDDTLQFDDSFPLVLIHGDLHMQNILLGKDGRLYLLDWGLAGAYPEWFEYCGIKFLFGDNTPWLWRNLAVPLITGRYPKQAYFTDRIEYALRYDID